MIYTHQSPLQRTSGQDCRNFLELFPDPGEIYAEHSSWEIGLICISEGILEGD